MTSLSGKDCLTNFENEVFETKREDNAQIDIDSFCKSDNLLLKKQGWIHGHKLLLVGQRATALTTNRQTDQTIDGQALL